MLIGEATRSLDDRYRLSLPPEMVEGLDADGRDVLLVKERPGCLSVWAEGQWERQIDQGAMVIESKIEAGRLEGRVAEVQALGRLLSTRRRRVPLAGRGRLVVPEGFREFLAVEPGGTVIVVGAAVCVELWNTDAWAEAIGRQMPEFRRLFDELAN